MRKFGFRWIFWLMQVEGMLFASVTFTLPYHLHVVVNFSVLRTLNVIQLDMSYQNFWEFYLYELSQYAAFIVTKINYAFESDSANVPFTNGIKNFRMKMGPLKVGHYIGPETGINDQSWSCW